jgi:hypothetical protein
MAGSPWDAGFETLVTTDPSSVNEPRRLGNVKMAVPAAAPHEKRLRKVLTSSITS